MHFQPRWVSRTRMLDRFRNPFCHLVSFMMWNHAYDKPLCEYNFVGTSDNKSKTDILLVTHWGLNKMAAALQTTYIQTHFLERYFSIMIQASCRSNALVNGAHPVHKRIYLSPDFSEFRAYLSIYEALPVTPPCERDTFGNHEDMKHWYALYVFPYPYLTVMI